VLDIARQRTVPEWQHRLTLPSRYSTALVSLIYLATPALTHEVHIFEGR